MNQSAPIHTISLSTHTYGGETLGRLPDGRAAFVPFALPGEKVQVRLTEEKQRYVKAELLEVLEPSPARINPFCTHFGICGGCHYQHLAYKDQLLAKTNILSDQIERIGGLINPPINIMIPSTHEVHYRNHVQFHLNQDGQLGYHRSRSNDVIAIQECYLPEEQINILWPQLDFEAIPELSRIGLRSGSEDSLQLILESSDPIPPMLSIEDLPISVVHLSPFGSLVLAGSETLSIEILNRSFQVSAGSFFQVNTCIAEKMVEHILRNLSNFYPPGSNTTIIDAYCGVGLFSAFLAPHTNKLIGIESAPSSADDFVINLEEFDNVELYEATLDYVLSNLDIKSDVMILDPPRSGVDKRTIDSLLKNPPRILIYVSCDPATLSRDARRLSSAGYKLEQLTPFDMFPQTYHIESISFWSL